MPAGLAFVRGVALVTPLAPTRSRGKDAAACISPIKLTDVVALGEIVEQRCPVATMFSASGCKLDIEWRLQQQ